MDIYRDIFGNKNRRQILVLLSQKKRNVGDLLSYLQIKQPTLSFHLAILRRSGLVSVEILNREHWYSLNRLELVSLLKPIEDLMNHLVEMHVRIR